VNTENSRLGGMSAEGLQRYVDMRHKLDVEADSILSITSMLALLETCGDDTIKVDPVALGKVNQLLKDNILNIWEILNDYIYIVDAKLELERVGGELQHGPSKRVGV